jgi:glycosyltransferase involved in cell wall biosynthesis
VLSFLSFMFSSFAAALQVRDVDVVWGTTPPLFQGATAWLVARLKRAAFVFEVRDLWPAFAVAVGVLRNPLLIALAEALERFLYRHADRLVVNSPGYVEHVLQRGARQVDLVPNGVDVSMFDRNRPDLPSARRTVCTASSSPCTPVRSGCRTIWASCLRRQRSCKMTRGLRSSCWAMAKNARRSRRGPACSALATCTSCRRSPRTRWTALAAADACIAILKPLDVYKTTYPNKVFDYMAAGRPVVLAIDGVIRRVIEEAGAGVFVPPGDAAALAAAIRGLAANRASGRAMGRSGRAYVGKHFDRGTLAGVLEQLMRQAAIQRGRR